MKLEKLLGGSLSLGLVLVAGVASAEETPAPSGPSDGHASGMMVQGRLLTSGGLASLGGGPAFLLGYQAPSVAFGVGLGINRIGGSSGDDSASLMLFQIMPTVLVDVWHSKDGRARANLIGGVGYGRGSISVTTSSRDCSFDALGNEVCSTNKRDSTASAGFVPVMLGFGGDYFLGRNFALGAEVGLQGAFTTGIDAGSGGSSQSLDGAANLQLAYGALRATFVLGD